MLYFTFQAATAFAAVQSDNRYYYVHAKAGTAGKLSFSPSTFNFIGNHQGQLLFQMFGTNANRYVMCTTSDGTTKKVVDSGNQDGAVTFSTPSHTLSCYLQTDGKAEVEVVLMSYYSDDLGTTDRYDLSGALPTMIGDSSSGSGKPSGSGSTSGGSGGTVKTVPSSVSYLGYRDEYRLDYWSWPAGATALRLVFLDGGGNELYDRTYDSVNGTMYLTCNGNYQLEFYNGSELIGQTIQYPTSEIVNPACTSYTGDSVKNDLDLASSPNSDGTSNLTWDDVPAADHYEIYKDGVLLSNVSSNNVDDLTAGNYTVRAVDGTGQTIADGDINTNALSGAVAADDNDPVSSEDDLSNQECADLICQCVQSLRPALDEISQNTAAALPKLDDLVTNTSEIRDTLNQMKPVVDSILDNMTVKQPHELPTIDDYHLPTLDTNKPLQHTSGPFKDNTTYFTDQGDAAEPDPLPAAPDPKPWKDENGNTMSVDPEITRDPIMQRDPAMEQDPVMQRDPVMDADPVMQRDQPLERDAPLEQDQTQYNLRWKSSDYP